MRHRQLIHLPWLLRALLFMVLPLIHGCGQTRAPERVFLITIDTLRADHLGVYGYPRATSPFLGSLAEEGFMFEATYSSCSRTAPSHTSLFTSLQPAQHRVLENGQDLDERIPTLAGYFSGLGYRTAGFTTVSFLKGLKPGFDELYSKGRFYSAEVILGEAAQWIRAQPASSKLFVWIHLFDVHEWMREDHVDQESLSEVRSMDPSGEALLDYLAREHGTDLDFGRDKILDAVDRYDGQILYTDGQLRAFFEQMQGKGLWIVTSDHGEGLGNHHYMGHGKSVYDEQIHVPLVFYFSDRRYPPRRIGGLTRLVDVAPTLAELTGGSFTGAAIPTVGTSLLALFENPGTASSVRAVFTQRRPADELRLSQGWIDGDVFAVRTERYKVIGHSGGENEIYDLSVDPFERENLYGSGDPEHERLLESLGRRYRAFVAQGRDFGTGGINPKYVEELKALGYL